MVDVTAQPGVVLLFAAQVINIGIIEVLGFGQTQYLLTLGISQEFTIVVQEFQCIPLLGVVGRGDDDTATGMLAHHG